MLCHEELQLFLQQLLVLHHIHHLPVLEELQASTSMPAETTPGHDFLGVFDCLFAMNFGEKRSEPDGLWQQEPWHPNLSSKWLLSLNMACFQSSTVQSSCAIANSSLCLLILKVRRGFLAIFMEGNFNVFLQLLWMDLTLTVLSSGMVFFSCNPVRVGVTFSLLFMLFRVAVENLDGRPLPGFCTGSRFSGFRLKSKSLYK